jgi:nucleoside transporter
MAKPALLCVMMFFQFFVWGSWYVTAPGALGPLGFTGNDFGWTYSVGPIAGMITPFFVGMVADRFFPTQVVLGVMHLLGAAILWFASTQMGAASPGHVNLLLFAYMLCYFPTLSLVNTVAMRHLDDSERQFPRIRVFGTIGWIAAGIAISWLGWRTSTLQFQLAAGCGAALGVFSFVLPHTPPPAVGRAFSARQALGLDALVMLKDRSFLVFMLCSFLTCIPLAFYYQMAERTLAAAQLADTPFKMTFGQMSEILFMVVMPFFFARLGVKWMLAVGMLAWAIRYALFSAAMPAGVEWMLLLGVILHGICYDFFFVTGQIYTDQQAPREIRGQAQGMLVLFTLGLGMFCGAKIAGTIESAYTTGAGDAAAVDWSGVYAWPAIGAGLVLLLFVATFRAAGQPGRPGPA